MSYKPDFYESNMTMEDIFGNKPTLISIMSFIWSKCNENLLIQDKFHLKALVQPFQWNDFWEMTKK